ncbi:MAG: nitroreductase family deazaflavin-dependent oxidoreductase [Chloroflexi bacterium]|nr:nitroreductase family deazaflavin-dependent oxidoreductase [Chloroflexota bacterium]
MAWLLRQPAGLYARNLGWLLGDRFAELTHEGRKSRRIYHSVVEVARFDRATHEVIVVSAWEGRTDWYCNIQMRAALEVRTGRLRFVPHQRFLTPEETLQEMQLYLARNQVAVRLMPWLFGIEVRGPESLWRSDVMDFFKGLSFRPIES